MSQKRATIQSIRTSELMVVAVIIGVAIYPRTSFLGTLPPWFDESFSLRMAEFSFAEIWERVGQDVHPPFYFWLLKCWRLAFGTSLHAARSLTALLGVGTVVAVYVLVRKLTSESGTSNRSNNSRFAASLAALFIAIAPIHVSWSLQIRMYVLTTLLAALGAWQLLRTLERDRDTVGSWLPFTLFATLLCYTHNFGFLAVAAMILFALAVRLADHSRGNASGRLRRTMPVLACGSSVAGLCSPWLASILVQRARVADDFWTKPLDWDGVDQFFVNQLFRRVETPDIDELGLWILQGSVLLVLILALGRRKKDLLVIALIMFPMTVAVLISLTMQNAMVPRYLIISNMYLMIALAVTLSRIPWTSLRVSASLVAVITMGGICGRFLEYRERAMNREGVDHAVARFTDLRSDKDILIVDNPKTYLCARVYMENCRWMKVYGTSRDYPFYKGHPVMNDTEYLRSEDIGRDDRQSFWLLSSNQEKPVAISNEWIQVGEMVFKEYYATLTLRLYQRRLADNATAG